MRLCSLDPIESSAMPLADAGTDQPLGDRTTESRMDALSALVGGLRGVAPAIGKRASFGAKRGVKVVRGFVPVNHALTSVLRAASARSGRQSQALSRYLPRVGLFETPLPNGGTLKMWSRGDDEITSAVYWGGWAGHEPETSECFWTLAASARVTLDIGAHVGYFGLLAAHANPEGRVHAFEPLPVVHERLRRNVRLNGLRNIVCHQTAVGGESGEAKFYHLPGCIPSSSSMSLNFMEPVAGDRKLAAFEVEVTTIDDFVAANDVRGVDLVKIDTEATEDSVLRGMASMLARDRPAVVCEILPGGPASAVEEILAPLGYRYYLLTDRGPQWCPQITPHRQWRNFLFRADDATSSAPET